MQQLLDWCEDIPPEPVSVSKEDAATYVTPFARDLLYEIVHPEGARVIAVSGGVGCGKSYAIAQAVKTVCLTRPKSHVLVSAGSLTLLMSVLKKRCDEVFGHLAEFKGGVLHPHYLFANGSVAEFRPYTCHGNSAESSNSWEGRDATLLIVDECEQLPSTFLEHSFQRCRLSSRDARGVHYDPTVVWIGRPGVIDHWVRKALEMKNQGASRVKVMRPRTFDNPILWTYDSSGNLKNSYLDNMRASMGEAEFNCITNQIPGSEMPTRGAVYGMFEAMEYPKGNLLDWEYDGRPCYASIDLGRAYPAVVFIAEVEVNGVWLDVIFDELQPDDTLTEGLIPQILARGHNLKEATVDPAGKQRNAQTGISDIALLRRPLDEGGLGIKVLYTVAKEKVRINAGISKMSALICNANKERHLCVSKQLWERTKTAPPLARTIRSLLLYSWDSAGKAGSATKGGAGQPDHIADAIRYWVIRYRWHGPNGKRKRAKVTLNDTAHRRSL